MKFLRNPFLILTSVLLLPALVHSARILAIYPSFIRSHLTVAEGILEELVERGNEVTLISAFRFDNRRDNMERKREILLEGLAPQIQDNTMSDMFTRHSSAIEDVSRFIYASAEIVNLTLNDPGVQKLVASPDAQFDLILLDHFLNDALLGFGVRFDAPVILTSSSVINKWIEKSLGNPHNPAYNPHLFLGYTSRMTFWQRIINVVVSICEDFAYDLLYLPVQQSMYQRFFGRYITNRPLPPLEDLIHNVSLAMVNSDRIFHGARALLPNVIEIGGDHIAHRPAKELPKDVSHYFSIADDGIFLFTLGASVKPSKLLSKEKLAAINDVIRSLPTAAAIVRWDARNMEHQSDNVVIGPQVPQVDMLADPKVRLLITNGGLLSIYEAIYYKKPIIGLPLFGDQFQSIALVEQHGIGRMLNTDNITVESFSEILTDVRTNPVYQQNIEKLHRLMFVVNPARDKSKLALEMIELVMETRGAVHLKAPALSLSVWQLYLVDVSATLVLILFLILAVPALVIGIILRRANARNGSYGEDTTMAEDDDDEDDQQQQNSSSWASDVKQAKRSPRSSAPSTPSTEDLSKLSSQRSGGKGGNNTLKKKRN